MASMDGWVRQIGAPSGSAMRRCSSAKVFQRVQRSNGGGGPVRGDAVARGSGGSARRDARKGLRRGKRSHMPSTRHIPRCSDRSIRPLGSFRSVRRSRDGSCLAESCFHLRSSGRWDIRLGKTRNGCSLRNRVLVRRHELPRVHLWEADLGVFLVEGRAWFTGSGIGSAIRAKVPRRGCWRIGDGVWTSSALPRRRVRSRRERLMVGWTLDPGCMRGSRWDR